MFEAKDRNVRGQDRGHKRKCSPKKKFPEVSGVFQQNFNGLKNRQCNFQGVEASRPKPRTSKRVLEDYTAALEYEKSLIPH